VNVTRNFEKSLGKGEKMKKIVVLSMMLLLMGFVVAANASPFCYQVGDVDGYGAGYPDQGIAGWVAPIYDGRSAAEAAATNGAQFTDSYSTLFPGYSPAGIGSTGSVTINLPANMKMTNGTFVVAMGDFQATTFGAIKVDFNGNAQNWAFQDGYQVTKIRAFVLAPAEIAAANLAGKFVCNLDHATSGDFIAFDWFKLCADVVPTPIPGSLVLLGSGILGMVGIGIRRKSSQP
jgi:hypothetical protein